MWVQRKGWVTDLRAWQPRDQFGRCSPGDVALEQNWRCTGNTPAVVPVFARFRQNYIFKKMNCSRSPMARRFNGDGTAIWLCTFQRFLLMFTSPVPRRWNGSATNLIKPLAPLAIRHCRFIGNVQQGWSQTSPMYRQCLTRQCLKRMQSNTADISALFGSPLPIYRQCQYMWFIGGKSPIFMRCHRTGEHPHYHCSILIKCFRFLAMRSAVRRCFCRLLRVLFENHAHTTFTCVTTTFTGVTWYVLFPNQRL